MFDPRVMAEFLFRPLFQQERGDHVWLEDPDYPGARSTLVQCGAQIVPVRVDGEGLDVATATRRGRAHAVRYAIQSVRLGVPMSLMRRLALLKWAIKAGAWVVEND